MSPDNYEGRLELTWTNKHLRLLAHIDGSYEWVPPSDYRVAEVRLLHDAGAVGGAGPDRARARDNLLIRGDALDALRTLVRLPHFAREYVGKVKLARYSRANTPVIGPVHNYLHVYAPMGSDWKPVPNLIPRDGKSLKQYRNPNNDPRGDWRPIALDEKAGHATASQFYDVTTPEGTVHSPPPRPGDVCDVTAAVEWAAYWPEHADQPFGDVMNSIKKYVVSNSLHAAEGQNSEIISGDVAQKLTDIKAQDRGDITMSGSPTTVRWLLREGLLDELNLLVHPIVVGDGLARLFPPDEPSIPLELLSAQTFKTGVLNLSYAPAKDCLPGRGGTKLRRERWRSSGAEDG